MYMTTIRYRDIDLEFKKHPNTGDISFKTNEESVKRSIRHLIMYDFYEKPFNPDFGSGISKLLFENIGPLTSSLIKQYIERMIQIYEPRVYLNGVNVVATPDYHSFDVVIQFTLKNASDPAQVQLTLKRIR